MAKAVQMKNKKTGITKDGYIGFSYSYFFLGIFNMGWLVPLYRGELLMSLLCVVIHVLTLPFWIITSVVFGLFFNKFYTLQLIEEGYDFSDTDEDLVKRAKMILGIGDKK
jgi:hypothetical protein